MAHKILLVEDDYALALGAQFALEEEGYEFIHAANLKSARDLINSDINRSISLILLDVMLPDGNGYELCKEIRKNGNDVPILFLTAVSDEANIVQGLTIGADDYIAKPYRLKELLSRIAANIRRYEMSHTEKRTVYTFGTHRFDIDEFRLYNKNEIVECTVSELRLLKELVINRGIVLSRSTLMERLYDADGEFFDDNTLSVYLKRVRTKLGEDAKYIETIRGVGYRFNE